MNFHRLEEFMDGLCESRGIPGACIAVYVKHEKVFEKCVGWADAEKRVPMSPDTIMPIYSLSKISTVTTAMRLIEEGLMELSAPVGEILPEYAHMKVKYAKTDGTCEVRDSQTTMTLEHLMTMAGGFNYSLREPEFLSALGTGKHTTRNVIRALAAVPLDFEPGTRFKYSLCHDVLGAVIEEVTGMTLGRVLRKYIYDPLNMNDTGFSVPDEKLARLGPEHIEYDYAAGHAREMIYRRDDSANMGEAYESGGGGLYSTLADYGKLADALTDGTDGRGTRILDMESINDMRTDRMKDLQKKDIVAFNGWYRAGYSYGLGVRTLVDPNLTFSLSRKGEFGWDGKMGGYLMADPDSEVACMYMQNELGKPWWEWHAMLRNMVFAGLD